MVIRNSKVETIRFDAYKSPTYIKNSKNYKELVSKIGITEKKIYVLILKLRIYSINLETNDEIFAYTVEITNAITQTTIEQDKTSLIDYINWFVTGADTFLSMKMPIFQKLEFDHFDTETEASKILDGLKEIGWYK